MRRCQSYACNINERLAVADVLTTIIIKYLFWYHVSAVVTCFFTIKSNRKRKRPVKIGFPQKMKLILVIVKEVIEKCKEVRGLHYTRIYYVILKENCKFTAAFQYLLKVIFFQVPVVDENKIQNSFNCCFLNKT